MISIRSFILVLVALLTLNACSSHDTIQPLPKMMLSAGKSLLTKKPDMEEQRRMIETLPRKDLVGFNTNPLILIDFESKRQYSTLTQINRNGAYATFWSGDNKSLTYTKGILVATRGIGADLMSLESSDTIAALKANKPIAETIRKHRYLSAENTLETVTYKCQIQKKKIERVPGHNSHMALQRFDESCENPKESLKNYKNTYWIDPKTRGIWVSRQFVGPALGYFTTYVLIQENTL